MKRRIAALAMALVFLLGSLNVSAAEVAGISDDGINSDAELDTAIENGGAIVLSGTVVSDGVVYPWGESYTNYAASYYLPGTVTSLSGGSISMTGTHTFGLFAYESAEIKDMTIGAAGIESPFYIQNDKTETVLSNVTVNVEGGSGIYGESCDAGLVINNCNVTQTKPMGSNEEWFESAIASSAGSVLTVNGGTYSSSKYAIYSFGTANKPSTVTVNDGTFEGILKTNPGDSLIIKGGKFTADPTPYLADGCAATYDGSKYYVVSKAAVKNETTGKYYATLSDAVDKAVANDKLVLLDNITVSGEVKVTKPLTIDGANFKVTGTARDIFRLHASAVIQNMTIENATAQGRCIDTRVDGITVDIIGVTMKTTSTSNNQPLTIGGNETNGLDVNVTNSTIEAGKAGYGSIVFVPVELTIKNSDFTGYSALYMKEGSAGSEIEVIEGSTLTGINKENDSTQNSFGTLVFEESDIRLHADRTTTINGTQEGTAYEVSIGLKTGKDALGTTRTVTNNSIILEGTINGNILSGYRSKDNNVVIVAAKHAAKLEEEGWTTTNTHGSIQIPSGCVLVNGIAEVAVDVSAKTPSLSVDNSIADSNINSFVTDSSKKEELGFSGEVKGAEEAADAVTDVKIQEIIDANNNNSSNAPITEEDLTIHVVPYLDIQPTSVSGVGTDAVLSFEIKMLHDVLVSTAEDYEDVAVGRNALAVVEGEELEVAAGTELEITIPLLTEHLSAAQDSLKVRHTKDDGRKFYYDLEVDAATGTGTFTNPNGFSKFEVIYDTRTVSAQYDNATTETYDVTDINATDLPTATKSGYTFKGWKFEGISGTYTKMTDSLFEALASAGGTVKATADFSKNHTGGSSSGSSSSKVVPVVSANTGDSTNVLMPMAMLIAAMAGLIVIAGKKRISE